MFHNDWKCESLHNGTHLHFAALMNDSNSARWLIANGAEVNAKNNGPTPLHYAAYNNATETAALLLKNGADVNAKTNAGWTPLDWAIYNSAHSEMQSLLKRHGGRCKRFC